jgi:hypothetical protein
MSSYGLPALTLLTFPHHSILPSSFFIPSFQDLRRPAPGRFLGFGRFDQELMELAHHLAERSRGIEVLGGWKLGSEFLKKFPKFVIEKYRLVLTISLEKAPGSGMQTSPHFIEDIGSFLFGSSA